MPELSVILCAHNPRADYLRRTLDALQAQSLPRGRWEFLLVDNRSEPPLANAWDLAWHPNGRHLREEELGLTPARLAGIRAARGELLVFVDDDNVLAPDYLENALALAREWPRLGAWGGSCRGEFEEPPPEWTRPYWCYLALREIRENRWSNNPQDWDSLPSGAGLCVRRNVALAYADDAGANPLKKLLGRKGGSLASCEDSDLVQTSTRFQLGFGLFGSLNLTHLIPAKRLTEDYLVALLREMNTSVLLLRYLREGGIPDLSRSFLERLRNASYLLRAGHRARRFFLAEEEAKRNARKLILEWEARKS
ncbi:MAG: glycosyltransferase [Chthoniobacteraceae bacterium]|nr:glycosyltransferase [Chthoniobacteraceae bacterium]